jgi:DnaK suppressor protein
MADSLTEAKRLELQGRLRNRRTELLEEVQGELLRSDDERYINLAGTVHDTGEAAVADLLMDLGVANVDRHIEELRDIQRALQRMHEGSYGVCIDCGGEIPFDRLTAHPTAKRCRECQQRHERERGRPTPTL